MRYPGPPNLKKMYLSGRKSNYSSMMIKYFALLFFLLGFNCFAQNYIDNYEKFPVFPECEDAVFEQEEMCFKNSLREKIVGNLKLPAIVIEPGYRGEIVVLFEVNKSGSFNILFVDAMYPELEKEVHRVFNILPQIKPGTYNNRPISIQFRMPVKIPLDRNKDPENFQDNVKAFPSFEDKKDIFSEYDHIKSGEFKDPKTSSNLNIPLSHEFYNRFDDEVNQVGTNFHSASKPFLYNEVQPYYDLKEENQRLLKSKSSWFGRKLWNEHLISFQGENYWFAADFGLDLQGGKDFKSDFDVTYNNTRIGIFQGGLGKDLNFYSVLYENQGRFSDYYNNYAESIKPDGGDPAIIPGRGIAKRFMGQGYDYPVAEGYLSYSPGNFFNIQFGHGKNFIGDGYRSLLLSDNATPYPYLKLNTTFWKFKYTNTWMSLRDVRSEVTGDGSFRTKFMANHYLSYNVTKRLNIGLFESVMWENDNNRGFDLNYLNPVIFYRAIEFSTGARAGNAIMGLTGKYKMSDRFNIYSQLLIDEFSTTDVFGGEGSWKNKLGVQLGVKYFNAFNIQNLYFQLEYNQVRPYTYSHFTGTLNYGHNNQSMAHLWGANFRELIGIARYKKDRYYGNMKIIFGKRGFDFENTGIDTNFGGNIYRSERELALETGVEIGQGNTTNSFFSETEIGYIVNPSTNLKFYGSFIYRNFRPAVNNAHTFDNSTYWVNFGIRTDIFNWYYDY